MKFSIIIFVVLAIVSVTTNNQTYDNNIKEMIEKLAQLTDATTDMPQKFEIISQRATPFVKLLGPVASLVALGLKISFNVGSDEYKAIKRLHELALNKFTKMEKMIELKAHEQMLMLMMMAYDEKVTLSIRTIEGLYKQVTMPDGDRRPFKSSFVHECKFGDTPRSALAWLNGVVNLNCRAMNEVQRRRATNYAKYIEIFTRFEKENKERPGEYYNQYRKQFFLKMSKMKSMTAKRMLNMMELRLREITEEQLGSKQIQNNTEKIYNAINETISLYDGYDFAYCLLDAVADARKWHRQAIYDLVDTIRQHAFKLAIIQSACINITYETPEEIDYHFDEMKTQLSGIMSKIADWLPIKLEKSWPTITAANILQNVGQDVDVKDPISMNRTAEKLQNEADLIGPQTYVHSVLVTAAGSESKFYQYNCDNTTCLYMGNIYGLNINVYQYNTGSIDHAKSADKWYKIFWFRIQQSISENFDPEDDTRTLFRKIEKDYPSLMNPKAFYNALLLSDSYPWMYPEIVVGIGVARIEGLSPVRNISFYSEEHPPRFYHIELYLHL